MNKDHEQDTLTMVKYLAGVPAERASVLFCDIYGLDVRAYVDNGDNFKVRIPFKEPVESRQEAKQAIIDVLKDAEAKKAEGASSAQ